jgi:hypothetical protein
MRNFVGRRFLGVETAVSVAITAGFIWWVLQGGGKDSVDHGLETVRGPLYGTLAAVAGALLGFVIATVSILVALVSSETPRMKFLRESAAYPQIWTIYTSAIRWLAAATAVSLVALLLDHEKAVISEQWTDALRAAVLLVSLAATMRLGSAMWVLEQLVTLVNAPLADYTAAEG